jgi:hypothetical protein
MSASFWNEVRESALQPGFSMLGLLALFTEKYCHSRAKAELLLRIPREHIRELARRILLYEDPPVDMDALHKGLT